MLARAARGVFTLLQATAIGDRWGATHYGRFTAPLFAPAPVATALAPSGPAQRSRPHSAATPGMFRGSAGDADSFGGRVNQTPPVTSTDREPVHGQLRRDRGSPRVKEQRAAERDRRGVGCRQRH
jgi:hypothetical protein